MSLRILVTGSEGVIGKPLVAELRERGHEVFGCDLFHTSDPHSCRADVSDIGELQRAFSLAQPEVVYHLAAEFGRLNGDLYYRRLWESNVIGTKNIAELCPYYNSHLIFASSSEIYGEPEAEILYEDLDKTPLWQPNEYALSKWVNEVQIVNCQRKNFDLKATRLRFFNAYGIGEYYSSYRSVVAIFCWKALTGQTLPVYQNYYRTFMYVSDFIPTLANVCEVDLKYDVYNIGGNDYRSIEELAEIVGKEIPITIEKIPEDKHNVRSKRPDITRAKEDLGHDPQIKLEYGIPMTLEWMQNEMGLSS